MFLGTHQHTLDGKGRVILPARFRDRLAAGVVLTRAQDRCLEVWPVAVFAQELTRLRAAPRSSAETRRYLRALLAGAYEQTPDGQGRITIPPELREYAGLDRELSVNGNDETVQVWDRARWEEYLVGAEQTFADLDDAAFLVPPT